MVETKRVPEEYTKSAPNTTIMVDGNSNAQYVADGSMTANKTDASPVKRVPNT